MDTEWSPLITTTLRASRAWLTELWSFPTSSPAPNRMASGPEEKGGRERLSLEPWSECHTEERLQGNSEPERGAWIPVE